MHETRRDFSHAKHNTSCMHEALDLISSTPEVEVGRSDIQGHSTVTQQIQNQPYSFPDIDNHM